MSAHGTIIIGLSLCFLSLGFWRTSLHSLQHCVLVEQFQFYACHIVFWELLLYQRGVKKQSKYLSSMLYHFNFSGLVQAKWWRVQSIRFWPPFPQNNESVTIYQNSIIVLSFKIIARRSDQCFLWSVAGGSDILYMMRKSGNNSLQTSNKRKAWSGIS